MAFVFAANVVQEEDDPDDGDIVTVPSNSVSTPTFGEELAPIQRQQLEELIDLLGCFL